MNSTKYKHKISNTDGVAIAMNLPCLTLLSRRVYKKVHNKIQLRTPVLNQTVGRRSM